MIQVHELRSITGAVTVLSIKTNCLGPRVLLGERHLKRAIEEYVAHFHLG